VTREAAWKTDICVGSHLRPANVNYLLICRARIKNNVDNATQRPEFEMGQIAHGGTGTRGPRHNNESKSEQAI
jgi:hypothetical protein